MVTSRRRYPHQCPYGERQRRPGSTSRAALLRTAAGTIAWTLKIVLMVGAGWQSAHDHRSCPRDHQSEPPHAPHQMPGIGWCGSSRCHVLGRCIAAVSSPAMACRLLGCPLGNPGAWRLSVAVGLQRSWSVYLTTALSFMSVATSVHSQHAHASRDACCECCDTRQSGVASLVARLLRACCECCERPCCEPCCDTPILGDSCCEPRGLMCLPGGW